MQLNVQLKKTNKKKRMKKNISKMQYTTSDHVFWMSSMTS